MVNFLKKGDVIKRYLKPNKAMALAIVFSMVIIQLSGVKVFAAIDQTNLVADVYSDAVETGGQTPTTDTYQQYTYTFTATTSRTPISFLLRHDLAILV